MSNPVRHCDFYRYCASAVDDPDAYVWVHSCCGGPWEERPSVRLPFWRSAECRVVNLVDAFHDSVHVLVDDDFTGTYLEAILIALAEKAAV